MVDPLPIGAEEASCEGCGNCGGWCRGGAGGRGVVRGSVGVCGEVGGSVGEWYGVVWGELWVAGVGGGGGGWPKAWRR